MHGNQPYVPAPAPASSLVGLGGYEINWPSFIARAALRAVIVWPLVRFIGGASGVRAAAAGVAIGAGLTGIELAFDANGILVARRLEQPFDLGSAPNVIDVTGHTTYSGQG